MSQDKRRIDEPAKEFLGDACRLMREKRITQAELARRLEVSPAYVSRILSGRANLTVRTLLKVSKALDAPMSLRLAPPDSLPEASSPEATATPNNGKGTPAEATDRVEEAELSEQERESLAEKLLAKLPAEAVARIAKRYGNGNRNGPGRPKGSGLIPDDLRLDSMADLLALKSGLSERQAADMIAEDDPGHSEDSTARRLRRKFAKDRERLLAAAEERLRNQRGPEEERTQIDSRPRRVYRPLGGARTPSPPPATFLDQTAAFVAGLQRDFQISQDIVDQLLTPCVLEEIAKLPNLLKHISKSTSALADATFFEHLGADLKNQAFYLDQVAGIDDVFADATRIAKPLSRAIRTIYENSVATDLSSQLLMAKDFGHSLLTSNDITELKAGMPDLETLGRIDRELKRLVYPPGKG